ncbi:YkvA family protein [Roseofilum sp. BLCC_M154]|uniref:YkvA family protein n=1 Tax=Roseofilum acuticapitatum BLCC-M154 TaxID=3022444 RepID=A0ABT7ALZ5_9CYAN|nr:YkvA family protein [Roseofilum acuticapitatum]MDJ1167924.1 YkvA family protein [Roseofilum acuticapitatum BLCC-M154]
MSNPIQSLYTWYRNMIRNPQYRWWIILGTLVYIFSPLDISPDVFPIAGQIDDVAVMVILLSEVSQLILDRVKAKASATTPSPGEGTEPQSTVDVDVISLD